jgi:hypothetical protein
MTLTRDAWLLYLGFAAVVIGYFAAAEQTPNMWTFKEWMQFLLVPIAWVTGKLQTSPLPGENDPRMQAARSRGETVLGSAQGHRDDQA